MTMFTYFERKGCLYMGPSINDVTWDKGRIKDLVGPREIFIVCGAKTAFTLGFASSFFDIFSSFWAF